MRANRLTGLRRLEMMAVPTPEIRNGDDALIKVSAIGVCGSDVHYFEVGRIGSQVVEYPFTVGHEGAGVIAAVGPNVKHLRVGDRVAIEPGMACRRCDQCRVGRFHTCRKLRYLGCPGQAEGLMSDYVVMPEECCFKIPDAMTMEQAALAEPLSIGVYAVKLSPFAKGADIGVLGCGPIGLSVTLPAIAWGAGSVFATDKIDARAVAAKTAGAVWTGNPTRQDIVADILREKPLGLDIVFECCGDQAAIDQALELLKPGGTLMLIGIPPTADRVSFKIDLGRRKEIRIQNVRRQVGCVQTALDLIASGKTPVDFMVTHRFSLAESAQAFELVAGYRDGVIKAMLNLD